MRVLFWGTPEFGSPALRALTGEGHEIVGVVTRPDRPAGRGRRITAGPVKREALDLGVPVLQPPKPRGETFLESLRELRADVAVVAAYGHILTEEVLELPPRGSLNIHASLLPELRGAAPVNWAIIRGHRRGGVTVMRMVRELDAGPILHQVGVDIPPDMTAGELSAALSELGAEAIVDVLARLEGGEVEEREQDHDRATYAPKLDREIARLDWSLPAEEVARWIRGCDPWPAAWSELRAAGDGDVESDGGGVGGREAVPVQLFAPEVIPGRSGPDGPAAERAASGTVLRADPREGLSVAAGSGAVRVGEVKPAGRPRMSAAAWVRGRGPVPGDRFR